MALCVPEALAQCDPLPSWSDGPANASFTAFVENVARSGSQDIMLETERIAASDNDGALWCERPLPVQLIFALDGVKMIARQHPEWKIREPLAALHRGDQRAALAGGDRAVLQLVMATSAGHEA